MPKLLPNVDPDGLREFSVVYTDRALNHMSMAFRTVMTDIARILKQTYHAHSAIVVPGSGTFGMEAVARQFATGKKCLVIRNGWFSYRWTQIFDTGQIPAETMVMKAGRIGNELQSPFAPATIESVVAAIQSYQPDVIFAPHVETASGMILPEAYLRAVSAAARAAGSLFVLDCIASGALWPDMEAIGIDVLISAPQKGWSGPPCCALVMLGERARIRIDASSSSSFACDLRKWLQIMEAYEKGSYAYHATLPTDALRSLRDVMLEAEALGFARLQGAQLELGAKVRELLERKGFRSVAADGFQAPGVVVSYTDDPAIQSGARFIECGLQIAAGVPLQCDEPADFRTFRIGLFGIDKLLNIAATVGQIEQALIKIAR